MKSFLLKNALILVIDDLQENLYFLEELLKLEEYRVICASNEEEALQLIQKEIPDLILLDLMMPKVSGFEICQKLKANPNFQAIPIIFLTASHQTDNLITAFNNGAADYITKPFNLPELFARIRTHLELKKTRDQLQTALKEQQKLTKKLERLATIDSLTQIANRRYFMDLANTEFRRIKRYGNTFSLFMLDIDYFKKINDTYGHAVGDQVLQNMAEVTTSCLRDVDIFGRLGGEEFAIVLPQTNIYKAENVAERIRASIEKMSFLTNNILIKITVSIGMSIYEETDKNIDDVLKRADKALYKAKSQGRNQVIYMINSLDKRIY